MKQQILVLVSITMVFMASACTERNAFEVLNIDTSNNDFETVEEDGCIVENDIDNGNPDTLILEQLTIDTNKIDLIIGMFFEPVPYVDSLSALQEKWPDLVLIDSRESKFGHKSSETWYSSTSGMHYILSWSSPNVEGGSNNFVQCIRGEALSLIIGLNAPVETAELMFWLSIPESDWSVGSFPLTPSFGEYEYNPTTFRSVLPNDICFVLPGVSGEYPHTGIKITPSLAEYISPTDEIEIRNVVWAD